MIGPLPDWLARWLDVPPATGGDAATWRMEFAWPWPPWATVLLVIAAVAWVAFVYRRESSTASHAVRAALAALRLIAIATILVMLSQVVVTLQQTAPPELVLLVDRSASMGITDPPDTPTASSSASESPQDDTVGDANGVALPRLEQAKRLLVDNDARLLDVMTTNYRLSAFAMAGGVERLSANDADTLATEVQKLTSDGPGTEATRLGDAVRQVLDTSRGVPPAAIVLLSDGISTDGAPLAEAAQTARERGVPIVAVGIGSERQPRDVEISDVLVEDVVFLDDLVSFNVQVKATGLSGETARVVLMQAGSPTPLAEQTITFGPDGEPTTVYLTHRPTTAGDFTYAVEIAPRDDETSRDNNRRERTIAVRDQKIRVLLAFGYPSYEFRFLKSLLERDSTVELSTYLQDADPDYAEQDRTALRSFPVARDALHAYDVIVFGDVDPQRLPRSIWPDVRSLVAEQGGGVVFIAGPRWLPWAYADVAEASKLMPIDVEAVALSSGNTLPEGIARGFVVHPTPLGLRLPPMQLGDTPSESEQIWQSLPPLYWLAPIDELAPAAQVLADLPSHTTTSGRPLPVIVTQYVGAGRVLFHAVDSTWRWRLGAGDVYFARYWVQTVRYLARGKLVGGRGAAITTDRREYRPGERVEVRLRFADSRLAGDVDELALQLESPGQVRRQLTVRRDPAAAGVFAGTITDLGPGEYELSLAEPRVPGEAPRARFTVAAPVGEFARTAMDRAALTAAAETTRGKFYTIAEASRLADELPPGRRVPIAALPPLALWNRWWLLALFLAAIISEWILRKRQGML
jgi:hypothetical protein